MANSQNGWPASKDRDSIDVREFEVAGVSFPGGVKSGDVATVLRHVVGRFHEEVEPLHAGWCWGHNYRDVTGGGSLSNHASGTAVDVNAPDHGYGASGTFSPSERAIIRAILDDVDGVVRWGGDYSGTKDEMHFEIVGDADAVAAVARKINTEEDGMSDAMAKAIKADTAAIRKALGGIEGGIANELNEIEDDTERSRVALGAVPGGLAAYLKGLSDKLDKVVADVAAMRATTPNPVSRQEFTK